MHIKKLEIAGFKSFVDRTVIHFDHDIVGVVGPNGCGKSNIVDSIRWCMGEQSAKHLRGRAMTDVIFAGSSNRGPAGMAEVTLTFDNSDRAAAMELPLEYRDWGEIAVTRRLYRDGESEYLINKTQVRLKDITDLFLGTGVGTKAYSIIEQGKVGLIVSARAEEDRRLLIEEAAGITKYKARRKQAEQKMELTRQNLLRVGDIVAEIERSLASLKRQAAKAERYISYKATLEDMVLHESSHRLLEIMVVTQVASEARAHLTEEVERLRTGRAAREAELEVVKQQAFDAENVAEEAQSAAFKADTAVRTHQAEIDRAIERHRELEGRRSTASLERNDLASRAVELDAEREALMGALDAAQEEEVRGADAMRVETEKLDTIRESQQQADISCTDLRRRASEAKASVAAAEATLRGFEERTRDMDHRREALEDESGRLQIELEDAEERRGGLEGRIEGLSEARADSAERREQLADELKSVREAAVGLDKEVEQKKGELSQRRNRLRALEELHARLEGVGQGPRALMQTKDPTILGLVGDRFEAPAELTHALAAALADRLQWVVVEDPARGAALLAQLGKSGKGRAGAIPRHPRFVAGARPQAPVAAQLGWLIDHIGFEEIDGALADVLLGDVLIANDDAEARELLLQGHAGRVVTLTGSLHAADGAITGGAGDAVAEGMIEHKREMRELHESVAAMSDVVTSLLAAQQASRTKMTELSAALDRSRNEAHQADIMFLGAEKDLKRSEEHAAQLRSRCSTVRLQLEELAAKSESARLARERASEGLDTHRATEIDLRGALETAEGTAEEWRRELQRQQTIVTERRVLLAQIKERANGVRQTTERLAKSCDEMRTRVERLDREMIECATGAGQAAAKLMIGREALREAVIVARAAQEASTRARVTLDEVRHALGLGEIDVKQMRDSETAAADQLRVHETQLTKLEMEHTHLVEGVRERFRGLELATVMGDFHKRPLVDAAHRARIVELQELLDRMGPVNLDAVREHAEAHERYTYYTTQKADLDKAIADLESAILQMNKETKRLFKEAFDGITAKFKVIFPRMFRGGQAELRLTNPDDMLETGIEILAQPPGKKLASIELMSGGEKALTAVSLIFSIFQFKPSPFCILDEVDAPLDEANVTRYNEAIRTMTDSSQFILITHIKKTMQSVDVLYGVTMQEPGVSKLVGVKVNELAVARSRTVEPAAGESVAVA